MIPSHSQYQLPKWQARLLTSDHHFRLPTGEFIASLWELRQALQTLDDDVLMSIIAPEHHVANWIEHSIKDAELAHLFRATSSSRWGMLLALEKHLMRSVSIPYYVAERWLAPAINPFVLQNGMQFNSLVDMYSQLKNVDPTYLEPHIKGNPTNFGLWVKDSIGDSLLSEKIDELSQSKQLEKLLADHIQTLQHFSQIKTPEW